LAQYEKILQVHPAPSSTSSTSSSSQEQGKGKEGKEKEEKNKEKSKEKGKAQDNSSGQAKKKEPFVIVFTESCSNPDSYFFDFNVIPKLREYHSELMWWTTLGSLLPSLIPSNMGLTLWSTL